MLWGHLDVLHVEEASEAALQRQRSPEACVADAAAVVTEEAGDVLELLADLVGEDGKRHVPGEPAVGHA